MYRELRLFTCYAYDTGRKALIGNEANLLRVQTTLPSSYLAT